jgi:protein-disulfide isomerase
MTAVQQEPGQLITAAGVFIRATLTGDQWTAQRTAALVKEAPDGYLYFSFLVAISRSLSPGWPEPSWCRRAEAKRKPPRW